MLISMGGKGAVLIDEHGNVYEADAPKGELKNSVGAGDSMVAGFMAGYLQTCNYEDALQQKRDFRGIKAGRGYLQEIM